MTSNINHDPLPFAKRFQCGGARAAPGYFPLEHTNLEAWMRNELRKAARSKLAASDRCRICRGKSPLWKVGYCPACGNTGKRK